MGAPTLRENFNGGKLLGLNVYKSFGGSNTALLFSFSLFYFTISIK